MVPPPVLFVAELLDPKWLFTTVITALGGASFDLCSIRQGPLAPADGWVGQHLEFRRRQQQRGWHRGHAATASILPSSRSASTGGMQAGASLT